MGAQAQLRACQAGDGTLRTVGSAFPTGLVGAGASDVLYRPLVELGAWVGRDINERSEIE